MKTPSVTVLMPVYNGERYLREALESILGQTFRDFEFLIINDGSTDNSVAIIQSYSDSRIRLLHNDGNQGLIATLNRGIEVARGEYVARMDCDDISLPERLAKQVNFMDRHQEVGGCGSWFVCFGAGENHIRRHPTDVDEIWISTLFNSMIAHPSVCMRRSALLANNLSYDPDYPHAEDYELWSRVLSRCKMANIPEVLLSYRIHDEQITTRQKALMNDSSNRVRARLLQEMGITATAEELKIHEFLGSSHAFLAAVSGEKELKSRLITVDRWLCRLSKINALFRTYPEPLFSRILLWRWMILWHLVFAQYGIHALSALCNVSIRRMTKGGWLGLVPILRSRGVMLLEEIRHQKKISREGKEVNSPVRTGKVA